MSQSIQEKITTLQNQALTFLVEVKTLPELEAWQTKYLGRKGELTALLRAVKDLSEEERPLLGKFGNVAKQVLTEAYNLKQQELGAGNNTQTEAFDVTLPGIRPQAGHLHPFTLLTRQLEDLFSKMGFMVLDGPEVESEYYNFESLNVPADHPARDMQDTYYIKDKKNLVLRTQTSNQQVRAIQRFGAPLRVICPGRVFRCEATDASHDSTFYQLEGLVIGKDISVANLILTLKTMLKSIFKKDVNIRLRPGYFPFVEPGFEVDMTCPFCSGKGCSVCKRTGWIELVPAGLVHPEVLKAGGLDPKEWSGFAFGLGLSRLVMMKYGINDIRLLLESDLRFLKQF
jgi:phenylalanyl-tRNA synthetase alpha chain